MAKRMDVKELETTLRKKLREVIALEETADILSAEMQKIANNRAENIRKADELRDEALKLMEDNGRSEYMNKFFTAKVIEGSTRLDVVNEAKVDDRFKETKVVVKKAELNKVYKETGIVPRGCGLYTSPSTLRLTPAKE